MAAGTKWKMKPSDDIDLMLDTLLMEVEEKFLVSHKPHMKPTQQSSKPQHSLSVEKRASNSAPNLQTAHALAPVQTRNGLDREKSHNSTRHIAKTSPEHKKPATQKSAPMRDVSQEDDLSDIFDDEPTPRSARFKRSLTDSQLTNPQRMEARSGGPAKCFPVLLSGANGSYNPVSGPRICDNVRCTSCDFKVSRFENFKWRPGTDYLFLRNNMPEFDRVRVKLASSKGSRAYGCQCRFVTVKNISQLGTDFSKWVCGGHSN